PHSIEAEQAVLGGIMLQPEAWDRIADLVTAEDFYRRDHRLIFAAIGQLIERNQPCDAITLGEWFESQQQAGDVGGMGYLAELVNNTPSAANVRAYAEIVREKSLLRRLIDAGVSIAEDGYRPKVAPRASWWIWPSSACSPSPRAASAPGRATSACTKPRARCCACCRSATSTVASSPGWPPASPIWIA
ncbi:replicative DNA helicase, partial [mine drainage metagenome]